MYTFIVKVGGDRYTVEVEDGSAVIGADYDSLTPEVRVSMVKSVCKHMLGAYLRGKVDKHVATTWRTEDAGEPEAPIVPDTTAPRRKRKPRYDHVENDEQILEVVETGDIEFPADD